MKISQNKKSPLRWRCSAYLFHPEKFIPTIYKNSITIEKLFLIFYLKKLFALSVERFIAKAEVDM